MPDEDRYSGSWLRPASLIYIPSVQLNGNDFGGKDGLHKTITARLFKWPVSKTKKEPEERNATPSNGFTGHPVCIDFSLLSDLWGYACIQRLFL